MEIMNKIPLKLNFLDNELICPCGCGTRTTDSSIVQLQALRNLVNEPLSITSSARCKKHNNSVGGANFSHHLFGRAFDIRCDNDQLRQKIIHYALGLGFYGIGVGKEFLHIDLRPYNESSCWIYGDDHEKKSI